MKRALLFLAAVFIVTLCINLLVSIQTAEAPEAQQIVDKGDANQLIDTPDGISLFGLTSQP